jgi:tetratricopeptide (TPR) repeat protein
MKILSILCILICSITAQSQSSPSTECHNSPAELTSFEKEAFVAHAKGRMDDSLTLLSKASREPDSINSPLVQARIENELGDVFLSQKNWSEAYRHKQRALHAFQAKSVLTEVRRTAVSLAMLSLQRKQLQDADQYLRVARSVPVASDCLDNDDHAVLAALSSWEDLLTGAGNAAIMESKKALEYWSLAHGANHPFTGWGHQLLADAYANADRSEEALSEFQLAITILGSSLPKSDERYLKAVSGYRQELHKLRKVRGSIANAWSASSTGAIHSGNPVE